MALCPGCKTEQPRRKNGTCPNCHIQVEVHEGRWFRYGTGTPTVAVLKFFEEQVSDALSRGRDTTVPFLISRIGGRYRRELIVAERLLEQTEWDLDLVKEAIKVLFTDARFAWKTRTTLQWVETEYPAVLALARANRSILAEQRARERQAVQAVLAKEDIFA